jgi:DNA polymerase III delta prime subunit
MQNTVYFGDRKKVLEEVKKELDLELRMRFQYGLEDSLIFSIEKLQISVDDVRRVKDFCYKTSENVKLVFLSSFYWSVEVQNAMLKVLEETPVNTYIFLFGYSSKNFLSTVMSRVQKVSKKNTNRYLKEAKETLGLEPNERPDNKVVKKILALKVVDQDYDKNKENEKKDRESHILFLYALIDVILNLNEGKPPLKGADSQRSAAAGDVELKKKLGVIAELADIEGGSPHLFIDWLLLAAPKIVV